MNIDFIINLFILKWKLPNTTIFLEYYQHDDLEPNNTLSAGLCWATISKT